MQRDGGFTLTQTYVYVYIYIIHILYIYIYIYTHYIYIYMYSICMVIQSHTHTYIYIYTYIGGPHDANHGTLLQIPMAVRRLRFAPRASRVARRRVARDREGHRPGPGPGPRGPEPDQLPLPSAGPPRAGNFFFKRPVFLVVSFWRPRSSENNFFQRPFFLLSFLSCAPRSSSLFPLFFVPRGVKRASHGPCFFFNPPKRGAGFSGKCR